MASGSGRLLRNRSAAPVAAVTARSSSSLGSATGSGWPTATPDANRYRRTVPAPPTVDLRSDTMTRPTPAMRRAMAEAEVGDDGWGEDPTVRRLEEVFADRLGKAAGLFLPSGTMANQVALRTLAGPGKMVVAGRRQHVVMSEDGAAGMNGAFQLYTVDDDEGRLDLAAAEDAVAGDVGHSPDGGRDRRREHPHGGRWSGRARRGARRRRRPGPTGAPRRRPAVQRRGRPRCPRGPAGGGGHDRDLLPEQGPRRAGRLGPGRPDRAHRRGPRAATAPRGRHAPGRASSPPPGLLALDDDGRPPGRRSCPGPAPRARRWPPDSPTPSTRRRSRRTSSCSPTPIPSAVVAHLAGEGVLAAPLGRGAVRLVTHLDVDDGGIDRAVEVLSRLPTPR